MLYLISICRDVHHGKDAALDTPVYAYCCGKQGMGPKRHSWMILPCFTFPFIDMTTVYSIQEVNSVRSLRVEREQDWDCEHKAFQLSSQNLTFA